MQRAISDKQSTITSFCDLVAWQTSHQFALMIYRLSKSFPRDETFALTSQMRRAAVSITSNIAEGFSRQTQPDKIHFYSMSLESLTELESQLEIAKDAGYIAGVDYDEANLLATDSHKLITGLIKSLRNGKGVK